ncbi:MAG: LacI family transcriptional regulator [Propionibacteriaceae bacterium]|jgi:DNA-binding LacI/PurR family transcriptional regulator|nr:LacI family transcriptional regulator [Propionibacteriaceae bacterium]
MSEARQAAPTLADVAVVAGVSHQTVSRVLNNSPAVSNATRQRVQTAVASLGYRRNTAARTLATGRSRIIGVIVVNAHLYGPSESLFGIEGAARELGYWVSVAGLARETEAEMADDVLRMVGQGAEGIVAIAPTSSAVSMVLQAVGELPRVLVTTAPVPADTLSVDVDQGMGIRQLMALLLESGHRNIAHVAGPCGHVHATAREEAWRETLAQHGLPCGLRVQGDWGAASGYAAAQTLLSAAELPTAVLAANDLVALGLMRGFHEAGVSVPRDISVVGFDDFPGVDQSIPPLTTVRQDFDALGSQCLEMLAASIEGEPVASGLVPTRLMLRSSTAAPRSGPVSFNGP